MKASCRCGHVFHVNEYWNGYAYIVTFRDDTDGSRYYGKYISRCPGCGDKLNAHTLEFEEPRKMEVKIWSE